LPTPERYKDDFKFHGDSFKTKFKAKNGEYSPLTVERMETLLRPVFKAKKLGRIIYPNDWLWQTNEKCYTTETPRPGWKLVTKDVLPNSTSKDYIEQTAVLRDYLQKLGVLSMEELEECSDSKLAEIRELMEVKEADDPEAWKSWEAAGKKLAELRINQQHRTRLCEDIYNQLLLYVTKGERLLEKNYNWTNSRSSDFGSSALGFINYGHFIDDEGAGARVWPGSVRVSNIGVRSVR
jgi:hypothetical protein